jgi:hypothetical protein
VSLRRFQNCNTLIINHFWNYGDGFASFDDEVEQYLCAAVLRPGNVLASAGGDSAPVAVCPCTGRDC